MKVSRVNCVVTTEYFKRGKTAVKQRVIRLLKTGSDKGTLDFIEEDMNNCMESFICSIDNLDEVVDGRYSLEVRFYPGSWEYPSECDVEYSLKKVGDYEKE